MQGQQLLPILCRSRSVATFKMGTKRYIDNRWQAGIANCARLVQKLAEIGPLDENGVNELMESHRTLQRTSIRGKVTFRGECRRVEIARASAAIDERRRVVLSIRRYRH